jgi:PEP-CTERM motif
MSPINRNARLAGYAALAGAALAAPAVADATIVSSGPVNINIPSTTSGIYLNVVTGVFATTPGGAPGWDINPWGSADFLVWSATTGGVISGFPGGSSTTLVDNLPLATLIDASSPNYGTQNSIETTGSTAFLLNSSSNYVGFRFVNESTGVTNFGWAEFSLGATFNGQPRTLLAYAYENTGAQILVGKNAGAPEPSTFALLGVAAAGALGVREWRKRKAA